MLYVLMSMLNFLIGGFTGVFLADVPADFQLHNTYFVVAHFHYTIIGGMVFAWLGATHYWFPKYLRPHVQRDGRQARRLVTLHRLQRRLLRHVHRWRRGHEPAGAVYMPYLEGINMWTSLWSFVLGLGFFIAFLNIVVAWLRGARAPADPWGGTTLEWKTTSPPPHDNFDQAARRDARTSTSMGRRRSA